MLFTIVVHSLLNWGSQLHQACLHTAHPEVEAQEAQVPHKPKGVTQMCHGLLPRFTAMDHCKYPPVYCHGLQQWTTANTPLEGHFGGVCWEAEMWFWLVIISINVRARFARRPPEICAQDLRADPSNLRARFARRPPKICAQAFGATSSPGFPGYNFRAHVSGQ